MTNEEKKWQQKLEMIALEVWWFVKSPIFLKNLAFIILSVVALFAIVFLFLRLYTAHGQSVPVGHYEGKQLQEAGRLSDKQGFNLVVLDSIHMVGTPGGIVLSQSPKPQSRVKKNRNIYVTIAKYQADLVPLSQLPGMYGYEYKNVKRQIEAKFQMNCEIKTYRFDRGPEGHILEVYYGDEIVVSKAVRNKSLKIPKGATLSFVLSSKGNAPVDIPDMVCKRYQTALFLMQNYGLKIGNIHADATVEDTSAAYIWKQSPAYDANRQLQYGDAMDLFLTQERPGNCTE